MSSSKMFSFNIPCLVYCRNHMPDEDVLELARKYSVPLLASRCNTSDVFARMLALPAGAKKKKKNI